MSATEAHTGRGGVSAVQHDDDRLLSPDEAAELLHVSAYRVRELARTQGVPALKLGRLWRFRRSSLVAWVAEHEHPTR